MPEEVLAAVGPAGLFDGLPQVPLGLFQRSAPELGEVPQGLSLGKKPI